MHWLLVLLFLACSSWALVPSKTSKDHDTIKASTQSSIIPILPPTDSIIDVLSSDVEFSEFLRHIQRLGLIPMINTMENVTLLAPINLAYAKHDEKMTSESLSRFVLNQKFKPAFLGDSRALYQSAYTINGAPYLIAIEGNAFSREYRVDSSANIVEGFYATHQHSYVQAVDNMVPMKKTICDTIWDDDFELDGHSISFMKRLIRLLSVDRNGNDLRKGEKDTCDADEIIQTYDDVASDDWGESDGISEQLSTQKHKRKKSPYPKKRAISCEDIFANISSLFIPTDDQIKQSLLYLEISYYDSLFESLRMNPRASYERSIWERRLDIHDFLKSLMVSAPIFGLNGTSVSHKSINNKVRYNLTLNDGEMEIINGDLSVPFTYSKVLADGVIHIFDDATEFLDILKVPKVKINSRKALFALSFSTFVKELDFWKLEHMIDGEVKNQTIVVNAERNDFKSLQKSSDMEYQFLSERQLILYDFLEGLLDLSNPNLANGLATTKLCDTSHFKDCYKMTISSANINGKVDHYLNNEVKIISGPYHVDDEAVLYITESDVVPPVSFKKTIASLFSSDIPPGLFEGFHFDPETCLETVNLLKNADLLSLQGFKHGLSVFLPCAAAVDKKSNSRTIWSNLGLIYDYLQENEGVLNEILNGMFVKGVFYSDENINHQDPVVTTNLNKESLSVSRSASQSIIRLNDTELYAPIGSDSLFHQGVIYIVDKVIFPDDFHISMSTYLSLPKLQSSNAQFSVLELLKVFPDIRKALCLGTDYTCIPQYSLLAPSPASLKGINITSGFKDLEKLLQMHLIPQESLELLVNCANLDPPKDHILTNLTGATLKCRIKGNSAYLALVTEDLNTNSYQRDHEVKISSSGCTYVNDKIFKDRGNCVFLVNNPLNIDWLSQSRDHFGIHIGFISMGVGIILGLIFFATFVFGFIFFLGRRFKEPSRIMPGPVGAVKSGNSSFMGVGSSNDRSPPNERGYETDNEGAGFPDREPLLPLHLKIKDKKKYGSTDPDDDSKSMPLKGSAPVRISTVDLKKSLNRDRKLPGQ